MINIINIHWINALSRCTIRFTKTPGEIPETHRPLLLDTLQNIMIVETFSTSHPALDRLARSYEILGNAASCLGRLWKEAGVGDRLIGAIDRHNQARLEALAARDWRVRAEFRAMSTRDL